MGEVSELTKRFNQLVDMGVIHEDAPVKALVHIAIEEKSSNKSKLLDIAKKIRSFPVVSGVDVVTGDFDFIVKVKAENVDSLSRFVTQQLRSIPNVKKSVTSLVLASF
jgi:DNA-binding Lrp family transcriptional regulator